MAIDLEQEVTDLAGLGVDLAEAVNAAQGAPRTFVTPSTAPTPARALRFTRDWFACGQRPPAVDASMQERRRFADRYSTTPEWVDRLAAECVRLDALVKGSTPEELAAAIAEYVAKKAEQAAAPMQALGPPEEG